MTNYQYTSPEDLSHLDQEFGKAGRLREVAGQVWQVNDWIDGDLYDVVEDWPNVPQLETGDDEKIFGIATRLLPISEEERMALHLGFGGTEDEVLALRAKDHRYTLRRN